jgi:hypothetical protein
MHFPICLSMQVLNPPSFHPRPWYVVFALTGVCEGNGQSVGVAEALAKRRYDGLLEVISQHLFMLFNLRSKTPYHNQRTAAAEHQTPENGGLVARSPVDVLARRGPESDGCHGVYVVMCW